jgi:hypothetical protein
MKKSLLVVAVAVMVTLFSQSNALAWGGGVFFSAPVPVPHVRVVVPFRPVIAVRPFVYERPVVVVRPYVRVRPGYYYDGYGCYGRSYGHYGYGYGYRYGY